MASSSAHPDRGKGAPQDAVSAAPALAKLPYAVVHLGKHDPELRVGGVETFARNLRLIFEEVSFMSEASADFERVRRQRLPVICDNHWVTRLPRGIPAIGFQHGVAEVKRRVTGKWSDRRLAWQQARAAKRQNTLWVACAQWISRAFAERYGNPARHVIYHQVDLERFDARLDNQGSHLVLHDARSVNKGSEQIALLARALPEWRFEALACAPAEVPARMSRARAFVHLSKYEGNSIVCNEAMAQNLPCLFTRVGLMQDAGGPTEVRLIEPSVAFGDEQALIAEARAFFASLDTVTYAPRAWVLEHASLPVNLAAWRRVMADFEQLSWPS